MRILKINILFAENGRVMFMWVGYNVPMDWVQNVFGAQSAAQIDIDKVGFRCDCLLLKVKIFDVTFEYSFKPHTH